MERTSQMHSESLASSISKNTTMMISMISTKKCPILLIYSKMITMMHNTKLFCRNIFDVPVTLLISTSDCNKLIKENVVLRKIHTNVIAKCSALWKKAGKPKSAEIILETMNHTFSYPVVTRWNSLFDSLNQILKDASKLPLLFDKLEMKKQMFTDNEVLYLKEYCTVIV